MDRLPLVTALLVALAGPVGCDGKSAEQPAAPASRVNAVQGVKKTVSAEEFCDKRYPAASAPSFAFPTLTAAPPQASGWRWVNIWATWCKPCVEEIPRLVGWRDRLGGLPLQLVSVDDTDQIVTDFRQAHPGIPETSRLADPKALPEWMKALGLDEGAPIPIHVFVDPQSRIRCVRAGGVADADFAAIEKIVAEK